MPTTFITGANGFVAAHIIDQLVAQGHSVTGSGRSSSKGRQILDRHPEYEGKLDFVVSKDFDYVLRTAAPLLDDPKNSDFNKDFLAPSVHGATELLRPATKYGKAVKAVAVTGSVNAKKLALTSQPLSIKDAQNAQNLYISYCVAKAEGEKAIWKYVSEEKPSYTVSVLLPALIFGPPIQPVFITPPTSFPAYIDFRDLAAAHINSLTTPLVFNQRFIVGGHPYSSQLAVNALKTISELKGRLPRDDDEVMPIVKLGDVKEWNEKLGLQLRTSVQTFGDAARRILELEKELGI